MTAEDPYAGVSILIVEDEPNTRTLIRGLLRQIGIRSVSEAAEGRAGLMELTRTRPTMVLCDVHMEPVDGRQFLKLVRSAKVDWVKDTPIIFLTADSDAETVKFAKEFHVNGYLVKPVSLTDLKNRVDAVMKVLRPPTGAKKGWGMSD